MTVLDWMKSEEWLANASHFLAGLAVVLVAALYSHHASSLVFATAALAGYAVVKEFVVDLRWESGETVASSALDFAGYMLGAAAGWANVVAAHAIGVW